MVSKNHLDHISKTRSGLLRPLLIGLLVIAFAFLWSAQIAVAESVSTPDGLQVLIDGAPYGALNIEDGLYDEGSGLYGASYYDKALQGSEISIGHLPEGWYILNFEDFSGWITLDVGNSPIWSKCSSRYSWSFKGVKIKRTLNEISNTKIYFDYYNTNIWEDATSNWVEAPSFNPFLDYQSPVLKMPKSQGVYGIADHCWTVEQRDVKNGNGSSIGTFYRVHPRDSDSPSVAWTLDFSGGYGGQDQVPESRHSLVRINGSTRYQTMSGLVDLMKPCQNGVMIIASAVNYPDALAASALAGCYDPAPIVLTDPNELSEDAAKQIQKRKPGFIYIIGGEYAVSKNVEAQIEFIANSVNENSFIQRKAGNTRYDTSLEITKTAYAVAGSSKGVPKQVIIATGTNFADALSVSSFAYSNCTPIVLCDPNNGISDDALNFINDKGIDRALILGGKQAVPSSVEHQLGSIGVSCERCSGETRYETSVKIAKYANFTSGEHRTLSANRSVIATGANFPDALAAGPVAGSDGSFVLLADDGNDLAVNYLRDVVKNGAMDIDVLYIAGGENAVSSSLASNLASSLGLQLNK